MSSVVDSSILRGQPFDGVMALVSKKSRALTKTIVREEVFLDRVDNVLIVNVYLPCHGTPNRMDIQCESKKK